MFKFINWPIKLKKIFQIQIAMTDEMKPTLIDDCEYQHKKTSK